MLACSSLLTVTSSSLIDCSSSLAVSSSSTVDCSSSLVDCSSSLADISSSLEICCLSMVACRFSQVCARSRSSSSTRRVSGEAWSSSAFAAALAVVGGTSAKLTSSSARLEPVPVSGRTLRLICWKSPSMRAGSWRPLVTAPFSAAPCRAARSPACSPSSAMSTTLSVARPCAGCRNLLVSPCTKRMLPMASVTTEAGAKDCSSARRVSSARFAGWSLPAVWFAARPALAIGQARSPVITTRFGLSVAR